MHEIVMGKSIGPIKIGMKRETVKALFEDVDEWRKVPYGMSREVLFNLYDRCFLVEYNQDDCVIFICCDATDELIYNGKIINQWKYTDLLEEARNMDPELEEDSVGFTSKNLGFGISLDDNYDGEIDAVQVVVEGYDEW